MKSMKRKTGLALSAFVLLAGSTLSANAVTFQTASLEWWVNIADGIVLGRVTKAERLEPIGYGLVKQRVTFEQLELLSGTAPPTWELERNFRDRAREGIEGPGGGLFEMRPGDRVLLFCSRFSDRQREPISRYANLTSPEPKGKTGVYDNHCRWISDGEEVLKFVRNRIRLGFTRHSRGLIVAFTGQPVIIDLWLHVITAEPEFKPGILQDLKSKDTGIRQGAISDLISYPGPETVTLLRPLLNDPTLESVNFYLKNSKYDRKWYPIRQAAYEALTLLGETVTKPSGYNSEMEFTSGHYLDYPWAYPSGKWRRRSVPE